MGAAMSPTLARLALRQMNVTEALLALAYAEGFGLVVGSLGIAVDPMRVVRAAAELVLTGRVPWEATRVTLPAHLRAVQRAVLADRLRLEVVARTLPGRALDETRLAVAQLGAVAGVGELAHAAGELMGFVRSEDASTLRAAVVVCDGIRAKLEAIAGTEATAPIALPPPPGAVAAAIEDHDTAATVAPRVVRDAPTPRERRPPPTEPR